MGKWRAMWGETQNRKLESEDQVTGTLGPIQKVMKSNQKVLRKGKQQIPAGRELPCWWLTACPALSWAGGRVEQCSEQGQARPALEEVEYNRGLESLSSFF